MHIVMTLQSNDNGPGVYITTASEGMWMVTFCYAHHPYIQTECTVYRIDERFNTFHLFEMKIKEFLWTVGINLGNVYI